MEKQSQRNKGFICSQRKGYKGQMNIDGVKLSVECEFWKDRKGDSFIHIKRQKMKVFDEKTTTFKDVDPKPSFECYARHTGLKYPKPSYKGYFIFAKFQYELLGVWNTREERTLMILVERTNDQPVIERLNKIMKEVR